MLLHCVKFPDGEYLVEMDGEEVKGNPAEGWPVLCATRPDMLALLFAPWIDGYKAEVESIDAGMMLSMGDGWMKTALEMLHRESIGAL